MLTTDQVGRHDGAPLILFAGISTAASLAHRAFPAWAQLLGKPWTLRGMDLPADTTGSGYGNWPPPCGTTPVWRVR